MDSKGDAAGRALLRSSSARLVPPALLIAVVAVSFASLFFRKAMPTHPLVAAGIRLAVAAILLAPLAVRSALNHRLNSKLMIHAALAGLFYALHFGAWVTSLTLTSIAVSVTLVTINPMLLALAGLITGRDRPDQRLWISIALALIGLTFIGGTALNLGSSVLLGDGLALLGAAAMSGYLLLGRGLGDELDLWLFSGIATAVGAIVLLSAAALVGIPLRAASWGAFGYLVLAAVVPQLVGHNLLTWCLHHTKPAVVAMAIVGEPVGATALGWIWLGEAVSLPIAAGCAITLAAVLLSIGKGAPISSSPSTVDR